MINLENCPICGKKMKLGCIYAPESRAVYWLPEGRTLLSSLVTNKNIINSGGFVLGNATTIGFFSKNRPASYYCMHCNIIITLNNKPKTTDW